MIEYAARDAAFHPTMVRFKVIEDDPAGPRLKPFHPTMVRFKDALVRVNPVVALSFHPTMVRFKGPGALHPGRGRRPFPSHYGAI